MDLIVGVQSIRAEENLAIDCLNHHRRSIVSIGVSKQPDFCVRISSIRGMHNPRT